MQVVGLRLAGGSWRHKWAVSRCVVFRHDSSCRWSSASSMSFVPEKELAFCRILSSWQVED
jgi:hypothetical protein